MKTLVHAISSNLKYVIIATTNKCNVYIFNRSYEMFQGNSIGWICV